MPRERSVARALRVIAAVVPAVIEQFRRNIDVGADAAGNPFPSLWSDTATFPGGGFSDRRGGQPLIETGRLRNSFEAGPVEVRGDSVVATITGADYARRQSAGFEEDGPVVIARLGEQRMRARMGDWSMIPRSDRVVAKRGVRVPPRPFLTVDAASIEAVASRADRGG